MASDLGPGTGPRTSGFSGSPPGKLRGCDNAALLKLRGVRSLGEAPGEVTGRVCQSVAQLSERAAPRTCIQEARDLTRHATHSA